MNWTELKRGDVLVEHCATSYRNPDFSVILILTPPIDESGFIEYVSLVSGVHVKESIFNAAIPVELDWSLERLP